jgi:hypothetical protein
MLFLPSLDHRQEGKVSIDFIPKGRFSEVLRDAALEHLVGVASGMQSGEWDDRAGLEAFRRLLPDFATLQVRVTGLC